MVFVLHMIVGSIHNTDFCICEYCGHLTGCVVHNLLI